MSRYHFISGVMCGWRGSEHPPPPITRVRVWESNAQLANSKHPRASRFRASRQSLHDAPQSEHRRDSGGDPCALFSASLRRQNGGPRRFGAGAIFGQVTNGLDIPESASVKMALFCAPDVTMRIFCILCGCRRCRRSSWATIDSKSSSKYSNPIPNMSRSGFDPQLNHELRN